ncbi:transmembrane protein 33 homolog isoform X2 [Panicum virgatum]|uniref:transmembrane protein 33 homolog isoform X2 n=1 Tax=Panicum virgatum TaxID=38727 RepID=UPI0019D5BC5C|nr:transmembrane protein 33 homolog isoform X2 [Panicum virgatum]
MGEASSSSSWPSRGAAAAAAYDYERDPRWAEYRASSAVPTHLITDPYVRAHLQHKFYRRFVNSDFPVEGMSSTISTQPSASSGGASTSASENARPPDPGTNSAGPMRSRLSLHLDQRSLHFSVNAWVLIVALIGIFPLAPRSLQYKGYRLSLLGTTCTTGYALFALYRIPRAGNLQAIRAWCHHVTSSKDFIPFMYCLMFVTSKLHLKLVLVPVICWALEHVARFLRRHFTSSSLYRTYLEQPCTWVEANTTAVHFLRSNAEILLGFLLILSLFSRQRNAMQTFMYWQLLKLMYHSPFTAGYHRAIWLKIGRTINPYIHRYTPFLHDPINAGMRWWFR